MTFKEWVQFTKCLGALGSVMWPDHQVPVGEGDGGESVYSGRSCRKMMGTRNRKSMVVIDMCRLDLPPKINYCRQRSFQWPQLWIHQRACLSCTCLASPSLSPQGLLQLGHFCLMQNSSNRLSFFGDGPKLLLCNLPFLFPFTVRCSHLL